jgi:hypothetical protein
MIEIGDEKIAVVNNTDHSIEIINLVSKKVEKIQSP